VGSGDWTTVVVTADEPENMDLTDWWDWEAEE